jgi:SagB-type dehydrogenase family enzyme
MMEDRNTQEMGETMSTWKDYLEASKYQNMPDSQQKKGITQPPLQMAYEADAQLISLPDPQECTLSESDFKNIIQKRESRRQYIVKELSQSEFSYLLWATQGVKEVNEAKTFTRRTVPSAGARHPFETYLLINQVQGLAQGLYRYLALEHKLLLLEASADINQKITEACLKQKHVQTSAVTFCWVADIARTYWRYGERSFRYILLDAGHVCQNLYLAAETIQCGVCAIAAFDDDLMNTALGVDGIHLFTAYIATLGKRE